MVRGSVIEEFRAFFEAQREPLRQLAFRLVGDWSEAEDLAQEALVRTFRAWKRIAQRERPDLYARACLVNRHRSMVRRAAVRARNVVHSVSEESGFDPDVAFIWDELALLPSRERIALVLHYYEDLTQVDIARVMGCAQGTVNSLVYRGLARLRARLESDVVGSEA